MLVIVSLLFTVSRAARPAGNVDANRKIKSGSYTVSCWYGPFPIAPLIQFGGSSLSPQASRAQPSEIVWQVLGGDAVEAVEPLFEAAVVALTLLMCRWGACGAGFPGASTAVGRNPGSAGEGGDWPAAVCRSDGCPV